MSMILLTTSEVCIQLSMKFMLLFRVSHASHLADYSHFYLSWILHIAFDLLGYIEAQLTGALVGCFFSVHNNTQLTTGLNRIALVYTIEAQAKFFQFFQAADVLFHHLTT